MLMIQSMVSALTRRDPSGEPARRCSRPSTAALYEGVRGRLERDGARDAAPAPVRAGRAGGVRRGARRPRRVLARGRGRCVCIPSSGVWIGALPAIHAVTRDAEFVLGGWGRARALQRWGDRGARAPTTSSSGMERLCAAIEAVADRSRSGSIRDQDPERGRGVVPEPGRRHHGRRGEVPAPAAPLTRRGRGAAESLRRSGERAVETDAVNSAPGRSRSIRIAYMGTRPIGKLDPVPRITYAA